MKLKNLLRLRSLLGADVSESVPAKPASRRLPAGAARPADFHCVSIKVAAHACQAAKQIEGHRFLPAEAPLLPLPGCANGSCRCRYEHYEDRRHDLRRNPFGIRNSMPPSHIGGDRRRHGERRQRDS